MFAIQIDEFTDEIAVARVRVGSDTIDVMATVRIDGAKVTLFGCHVGGAAPNRIGPRRLLALMEWVMQEFDVDELRIEGATRTSGASPGHIPRPLVFRRVRGGIPSS